MMIPVHVRVIFSFLLFALLAAPASAWELQWYGQSAFKITTPGNKIILIDPFITQNPVTPEKLKDLDKLGNVDLVLVTHGHGDHLGDTAKIVETTQAKVGLNADMGETLSTLGLVPADRIIGFNKSGSIQPLKGVTVTMVHAEHSSEIVYDKHVYPGGEPAGFIIKLENGYTIYHAGDTGVFGDMRYIADYYKPDLALLPIGGHYTMDPEHAAYAVNNLLKTKTVIPIHYGTFPPLKGTPETFKKALGDTSSKVIVMKPGEVIKF